MSDEDDRLLAAWGVTREDIAAIDNGYAEARAAAKSEMALLHWLLAEKTHIINTMFAAGNTVTVTNLPPGEA